LRISSPLASLTNIRVVRSLGTIRTTIIGSIGHLGGRSCASAVHRRRRIGLAAYRALAGQLCGTRIRHCTPPLHVRPLSIAMVFATFVTRLVPGVGSRLRQPVTSDSTLRATVDLASIATAAEVEDPSATGACCLP
jgi:hypothetical protein